MNTTSISASAMSAFGVDMSVMANNIANMNTNEFKASHVDYATRPYDSGVQVGAILKDTGHGALVPNPAPTGPSLIEGSNVVLEREFTNMISTQNAYAANASFVRLQDRTTGYLINMIA